MTSNVADASGRGNNGSLVGQTSTTTVRGRIGQALSFDGSDDYVTVADSNSLDFGTVTDYTLSLWVRRSNTSGVQVLIDKRTSEYVGFVLYFNGTTINFRGDGVSGDLLSTATLDSTSNWYHVIFVNDRDGTDTFYVDGVVAGTRSYDSTGTDITNTTALRLGHVYNAANYKLAGSLDDVRVYNRALSADEIKRLYDLGR